MFRQMTDDRKVVPIISASGYDYTMVAWYCSMCVRTHVRVPECKPCGHISAADIRW